LSPAGTRRSCWSADVGNYERWATTIDDALGEAFDKTAKLLGLPYPGGPNVERIAETGNPHRFDFPSPLKGDARPDFSFSGLKTAVRQAATAISPLTDSDVADIAASFQHAIKTTLRDRVLRSLDLFRDRFPAVTAPVLVVAGGVAANRAIRADLEALCRGEGFVFHAPPPELCTDNAAMIAWAAIEKMNAGQAPAGDAMSFAPRSRWPLDEAAAPLIGAGKRGAKA
jgi:N6-L-threonylcarbamoyladenine synthase